MAEDGRGGRSNTWAFLAYPESLPDDWLDLLRETHIPIALSPLHDRDEWTAADEARDPDHKAGTLKKPHYHGVLYFESLKSAKQVLDVLRPLGIRYVEHVHTPLAYNRYLCHLDDPDKAQYPTDGVLRLNGAACNMVRQLSSDERDALMAEMTQFLFDNGFEEYAEFVAYCLSADPDWFKLARTQTVYFRGLFASMRGSREKAMARAMRGRSWNGEGGDEDGADGEAVR